MSGLAKLAMPPQIAAAWSIAKIALPIVALLGVVAYVMVLRHEVSSRDKTISDQKDWAASVVSEVSTGQCAIVRAADKTLTCDKVPANVVPVVIHAAYLNWLTTQNSLDRQSEALVKAKDDAVASANAAHAATEATTAQKKRAAVKDTLTAPTRSTGLQQAEWNDL